MNNGTGFMQSVHDFPLTVSLGGKAPAWGLSRRASAGLRFVRPDDEGFTLRGDRQRLIYRGRKRSHRFTILGDTAFEYDCILNREPESNVITLPHGGGRNGSTFSASLMPPETLSLRGVTPSTGKKPSSGEGEGNKAASGRDVPVRQGP
jgi:hypothetical protein